MITAARPAKPDAVCVAATDRARAALLDLVEPGDVGGELGHVVEAERVVTHLFACTKAGYRGWRWSVTVVRAPRQKVVTIDEIVLLPGEDAIVAPEWVPWRQRIKPGDLGPGDLLPTADDDPRLVPGYTTGDDEIDEDSIREVSDEFGLGRPRLLSFDGRAEAAQRWYDGDHGPEAPVAVAAPAPCETCGFLTRLAGPLSRAFGVCANGFANDDGRVVSYDHGCGAHSDVQLSRRNQPQPLPEPVLDELTWDQLETF